MKFVQRFVIVALFFGPVAAAVAQSAPKEIRVVTWNVEWLFDHITSGSNSGNKSQLSKENSAPSAKAYYWRVEHIAKAIAEINPTVLALQEIENKKVLNDLADELKKKHGLSYSVGFVQGFDSHTEQDVGFLYKSGTGKVARMPFDRVYRNQDKFYMPSRHAVMDIVFGAGADARSLTIVNVHLKAGRGIANEQKRVKQARVVRDFLTRPIQQNKNILILGDFNAGVPFSRTSVKDGVGVMVGLETATKQDDFLDAAQFLSPSFRQTHIGKRELDRVLISPALVRGTTLQFVKAYNYRKLVVRGNGPDRNRFGRLYKIPTDEVDLSDHYPLAVTVRVK